MATIKDVPAAFKTLGTVGFLKKLWAEISEDGVFTWASALAYSWVFALFPLVLAIVTLAPYLPGQTKKEAIDQVASSLERSGVSGDAGKGVKDSIIEVMTNTNGSLFSIGLFLAIWSASGGMAMTMTALDKAYGVKSERSFLMQRAIAVGLTVATIVIVLVVMFLLPIGGRITDYLQTKGTLGTAGVWLVTALRYAVALALLFGVLSLVYYFGPNIKQKFQAISPGAIVAVVTWVLLGVGFGIYVNSFGNFNKTYGTLGAAIALLLFLYLSAAIVLIGAEINSMIDFAVLGVEPGTRDFTRRVESGELKPTDADTTAEDALSPVGSPQGPRRPAGAPAVKPAKAYEPTAPLVHAPAGWWKWAAAAMIGGWAYKSAEKRVTTRVRGAFGG
ncbi:MAG TPA: YihY/virulence factor BrkB family protein [Humisphaera sp.]